MRFIDRLIWILVFGILTLTMTAEAQEPADVILYRDADTLAVYVTGTRQVRLDNLELVRYIGGGESPTQKQPHFLPAYASFSSIDLAAVRTATCLWLVRDKHDSTAPQNCQMAEVNGNFYLHTLNTADVFWHNEQVNVSYPIYVMRGEQLLAVCDAANPICEIIVPDAIPTPEPPAPEPLAQPLNLDLENLPDVYKVTAADGAKVYLNPDTDSAFMAQLPIDFQLEALAAEADWVQVEFAGTIVYLERPALDLLTAQEHFNNAYAHSELEEYIETIEDYTRSIALCVEDCEFDYTNRGFAYFELGDFESALRDYERALENNREFADAYLNRGWAYFNQQRLDEAITDYTQALEINPDFALAYNNRGLAYKSQNRLEEALRDYERSIELNPQLHFPYYNRAIIKYEQGDMSSAIADFSYAIELNPDYASAYNNRGAMYHIQGNLVTALADYTRAIESDLEHYRAYTNRGVIYHSQGNLDAAITDYTRAIELNNDPYAYNNRGEAYFALGDYERALQDFNSAFALIPELPIISGGLAITQHALGDSDAALDIWQRLLETDSRFMDADWVGTEFNWHPTLIEQARELIAELETQLSATPPGQ